MLMIIPIAREPFPQILSAEVGGYVCGESIRLWSWPAPAATLSGDGPRTARRRLPERRRRHSARSATTASAWRPSPRRVGISAAALYRHYSSKYELFRDAVLNLGQQLVDCTAFADEAPDDDPQRTLRRLVAALTDTALANRESGGLYRWEARYLRGDDQATLNSQLRTVHHRIQQPLKAIRPDLTPRQRWTLSTSVLSVIGSIVDHRAKLPAVQIRALLAELADTVLAAELPQAAGRCRRVRRRCMTESLQIRSAAGRVDAVVQPEGLSGHQHGGHRGRGGDAGLGYLPVLLRQERHPRGGFPPGGRSTFRRAVVDPDHDSRSARRR